MGLAQEMGALGGNLSAAVDDCSAPVVVVRSYSSGVIKGRVQPPVEQFIEIDVSVQPLNQKELRMLPEGMRNDGRVKCYSTQELFTTKTSECKIPDRIIHNGITYQVASADGWNELGGYFRCEAVRINR